MGILIILFGVFIEMPKWLSIVCYVLGGMKILFNLIKYLAQAIQKRTDKQIENMIKRRE